ncbi:hypothetical protein J1N35_025475 [Gossypium stocksii]|uniref:Uncharacterized protein n=1 Tax=Gossypium stocksii TaxID=47602 RepID=A0A9D3V6N3_9ROSI|nr:hypothetical protein J1N35_025475 [Gossypium stocksii]
MWVFNNVMLSDDEKGSVVDGRVLRDAISSRHGLKVPHGCYYLVDAGCTNCDRFLAPFKGQRYHLNELRQGYQPSTSKEFSNMKHASTRSYVRFFTIKCFFPKFSRNQKDMGPRRRCCVGYLYGRLAQCWNL